MLQKNILIFFIIFCLTNVFVLAQDTSKSKGPELTFDNEFYDYGIVHVDDVPEGNVFKTIINFKNTGNEPLIIDSVRVCCNVTLTDWTKEPIMPEEKGTITVELRIHQRVPHRINRSIIVISNCRNEQSARHRLLGTLVDR